MNENLITFENLKKQTFGSDIRLNAIVSNL